MNLSRRAKRGIFQRGTRLYKCCTKCCFSKELLNAILRLPPKQAAFALPCVLLSSDVQVLPLCNRYVCRLLLLKDQQKKENTSGGTHRGDWQLYCLPVNFSATCKKWNSSFPHAGALVMDPQESASIGLVDGWNGSNTLLMPSTSLKKYPKHILMED